MNLYPLLFKPIIKKMIWGSESWNVSCRPFSSEAEISIVENGPMAGTAFNQIIAQNKIAILGSRVAKMPDFPLLIKIIDAKEDLSVQVHPDDAFAAAHHLESGKSEIWYVLEGDSLIAGLTDDATAQTLLDEPKQCLRRITVKRGDIINIPAGLVHAITAGVKVAEIQQNSDITFRLYDYDRLGLDGKPRALHLKQGIAAVNFDNPSYAPSQFDVKKCFVDGELSEETNPETFIIFVCVEGSCSINGVKVQTERSIFIPAALGKYTIKGEATLLKVLIP